MTMKRILLLFLLFCGGYVHAQELELDSARIHYRQGHREVDVLFRDNRAELERFIRTLREEHGAGRLESVVIRSWASPEGVNRLNEVLSERRADSLKAYLVRHAGIPDSLICIHGEGIAWDMLRQMVAASDILYKEEVLHILDHTPVWVFDKAGRVVDGRKKQLMDLRGGMPYTYMLENFFPDLRSSLSVACYRKPEPPVKVITQKETKLKEPEPVLQPDSVAETTSGPATEREEVTVQPQRLTVQRLAVKTNLLYDAILMPSLEVEYRISDRWTVNLEGDMAWWKNDGKHKYYQVATIDRFLTSSDYLSLQNITLGYTLPKSLTRKMQIDGVRVFFVADNVALLTARKGLDPRQGYVAADNVYSPIRTISGGISLNF